MMDRASTFVENPYNRKYARMDGIRDDAPSVMMTH